MLRSRITPCLLIHDNGLVKTRKFTDPKYVGDPLNAIKIFNEKEVDELMLFDIDASRLGTAPNLTLLKNLASECRMPLCYGGGVTSAEQASSIISLGIEKVSISSAALKRPELVREISIAVGAQSTVVTIDVRKGGLFSNYQIYSKNGKEKNRLGLLEFCEKIAELGAGEIVINNIDRDGEMNGYDLELAMMIRQCTTLPLTFLGGAGTIEDMQKLIDSIGVVGAASGSMFVFKGVYRAVLISYDRPGRLI